MKIKFSIFALFLFAFTVSAQERYSFKIGHDARQIPLDIGLVHYEGLYDIIVRANTLYCLEDEQVHILPILGITDHYVRFPLDDQEVAYSFCFLSDDSLAIVIKRTDERKIAIMVLSISANKVLFRKDCQYDISSNEFQGIMFNAGKLYVPVTNWSSGIVNSLLILDVSTTQTTLISQDDFFKKTKYVQNDNPIFSDNALLYTFYLSQARRVTIIEKGKIYISEISTATRFTQFPFRLESKINKLWYSEIKEDSLIIRCIKYKQ